MKGRAPLTAFMRARTNEPFQVLVATILSARTRDQTTSAVCRRLFRVVRNTAGLRAVTESKLRGLIFPVGFYRTKARHLKMLPEALDELFGGVIPDTVEELCRLPGVGRKTANLVVAAAFDKPAICVDVHVHRICNRLGLLRTRTPLETEMKLRRILPVKYWKTWNTYLVSYGQTLCLPRNPRCTLCSIARCCSRVGLD